MVIDYLPPFPLPNFPLKSDIRPKHDRPFRRGRIFHKNFCYGYLAPDMKIDSRGGRIAMELKTSENIYNFQWHGSMNGIMVGSNGFKPIDLRRKHTEIDVVLDKIYCEDIGIRALDIYHKANVTVKNSAFRGDWKLNPLVENAVGQGNIVRINGGTAHFENCYFYNSINPILINANSRATFRNCYFAICNTAFSINGQPNPRQHDEFDGGKAGPSVVTIENCKFFKVNRIGIADEGGEIQVDFNANVMLDGGTFARI